MSVTCPANQLYPAEVLVDCFVNWFPITCWLVPLQEGPVSETAGGPNEIQRIALDLPCVTIEDLAEALGELPGSLRVYREGCSRMSPVLKHRLAEFLRQHASTMTRLAAELDRSG